VVFIPRWSRYSVKPDGPVEVDFGHELAKGLRNALIFNEAAVLKTPGGRVIYTEGVAKFDGSTTTYDVADDLSWMKGKNEYSISAGITPAAITGNHVILAVNNGGTYSDTNQLVVWVDNLGFASSSPNCISFQAPHSTSTPRVETAANSLAVGVSARFTCRQKGSSASCYIDGKVSGNVINNALSIPLAADYFKLGSSRFATIPDKFNGSIDYLLIHDRDLSPDEIATIAENPYQLLKTRRRFWVVSSAGADITGSLSASESGSDTASAMAGAVVSGDFSGTEPGNDSATVTANAVISGAADLVETGSDSASLDAGVAISGDLAATETGSDEFSATIGATFPEITGDMAASETGTDVLSAAAGIAVVGVLSFIEAGSDSAGLDAVVAVSGSLAVVDAGSDGFVGDSLVAVSGTLNIAESGADTASVTGASKVSASLAVAEAGTDDFSAVATLDAPISAIMAAVEFGSDDLQLFVDAIISVDMALIESGQDVVAYRYNGVCETLIAQKRNYLYRI
jgi:hypothetical protein